MQTTCNGATGSGRKHMVLHFLLVLLTGQQRWNHCAKSVLKWKPRRNSLCQKHMLPPTSLGYHKVDLKNIFVSLANLSTHASCMVVIGWCHGITTEPPLQRCINVLRSLPPLDLLLMLSTSQEECSPTSSNHRPWFANWLSCHATLSALSLVYSLVFSLLQADLWNDHFSF